MTGQRRWETVEEWVERIDARRARLVARPHYVYRAFDDAGLLLYIGCSVDVKARMTQHRSGSAWHKFMARLVVSEPYDGFDRARAAERKAIDTEGAFFNASQADIQRTQANRNEALRRLTECGIYPPQISLEELDDPVACDLHNAEADAFEELKRELCVELKSKGFPFLTVEDRVAAYLAARSARAVA